MKNSELLQLALNTLGEISELIFDTPALKSSDKARRAMIDAFADFHAYANNLPADLEMEIEQQNYENAGKLLTQLAIMQEAGLLD